MNRLRFLRQPGGIRIALGVFLVVLLLAAALTGSHWTRFTAREMDLEHPLAPPQSGWLLRLTTTAEGRASLARIHEIAPPTQTEDGVLAALEEKKPVSLEIAPSGHALGTDKNGRDMIALLVAGAKNCLLPGLLACAVALGLGIPLGLLAGYYESYCRKFAGLFNGILLSMPRMVLILVVICALEPNVYWIMAVLGLTLVPRVSELLAGRVRVLARSGFILAAREGGLGDARILIRHLFWYQNRAVFWIQFSLIMAESILVETTLSYLQFGTRPPEVSWGNIIEGSRLTFFSGQYWITLFPAAAIVLAILGFFCLGDGLNARLAYREGR